MEENRPPNTIEEIERLDAAVTSTPLGASVTPNPHMTNGDEMRGAEERRNGSGGGGVRPQNKSLVNDKNGCDYCDFYDDTPPPTDPSSS